MITNKQFLEILIKYDPSPFMVQDTLELSDSQYLCDNLETLFENVQEKQGTLSALQAFDDGFCCINDSIKYRYFVLNIKLFPFWGRLNPLMVEAYSGFIMIK